MQVESMVKESAARLKDASKRKTVATKTKNTAEAALAVVAPQWEAAQRAREALQQLVADLRLAEHGAEALMRDVRADWAGARHGGSGPRRAGGHCEATRAAQRAAGRVRRARCALARGRRRKALADSLRSLSDELATIRTRQAAAASIAGLLDGLTTQIAASSSALEESNRLGRSQAHRMGARPAGGHYAARRPAHPVPGGQVASRPPRGPRRRRGLSDLPAHAWRSFPHRATTASMSSSRPSPSTGGTSVRASSSSRPWNPGSGSSRTRPRQCGWNCRTWSASWRRSQAAAQELVMLGRELAAKEQRHEQQSNELHSIPGGFNAKRHGELGT